MSALDDVLSNPKFVSLMQNGAAFNFVEDLLKKSTHQDLGCLSPLTFENFFAEAHVLDPNFAWRELASQFWDFHLAKSEYMMVYQKKEVGSLIRFPERFTGNHCGIISKNYLHSLPTLMTLNPAQLHEVEFLLKKGGDTLGMALPPVQAATTQARQDILIQLAMEALLSKPNVSRQKFLSRMKVEGFPENLTPDEFIDFVRETLTGK